MYLTLVGLNEKERVRARSSLDFRAVAEVIRRAEVIRCLPNVSSHTITSNRGRDSSFTDRHRGWNRHRFTPLETNLKVDFVVNGLPKFLGGFWLPMLGQIILLDLGRVAFPKE